MWDRKVKIDLKQVNDLYKNHMSGIFTIKPRVLLGRVESESDTPVLLSMQMPSSDIGSISLLEGAMLVAISKLINPNLIFEYGTYLGYTTTLLTRNTNKHCLISSIDLGDVSSTYEHAACYSKDDLLSNDTKNDDYLRLTQAKKGEFYLRSLTFDERERVTLLKQDSNSLDVFRIGLNSKVDLVFIDGGHDSKTITSDTSNAMKMIGNNGVIVWHDFDSSVHRDVTDYMMSFCKENVIIHIESTMLVLFIKGDAIEKVFGKVI
jgi:predicted O-methyltransferase YrrM